MSRHLDDERLGDQPQIHIFRVEDDSPAHAWAAWLNPDETPDAGLCLAVGPSREAVRAEAVRTLEALVELLQAPPAAVLEAMRTKPRGGA